VRDYLVNQGLSMDSMVTRGLGEADPVGDNKTGAGRQQIVASKSSPRAK